MDDVTRRVFVKSGAGAAAGLMAVAAFEVPEAQAKGHRHRHHSDPVVAWIGDPRDGKITVMSGKREVTIHDRKLAERIARAAR